MYGGACLQTECKSVLKWEAFTCEQCDCISRSGDLKTYKRAYSGETPYKCEKCYAAFSLSKTAYEFALR